MQPAQKSGKTPRNEKYKSIFVFTLGCVLYLLLHEVILLVLTDKKVHGYDTRDFGSEYY